jgi:hypothetical protein
MYALVLKKENAVKEWVELMGPGPQKKVRKAHPNS